MEEQIISRNPFSRTRLPVSSTLPMLGGVLKIKCHKVVVFCCSLISVIIIFHYFKSNNNSYPPNGFLESVEDTYRHYRGSRKRINPLDFTYTIPGEKICGHRSPFLLIFVVSLHTRRSQRDAIRSTWGSVSIGKPWPRSQYGNQPSNPPPNLFTKVVFLFGYHPNDTHNRELLHESAQHNDVVQANFTESYRNLTRKVLMGLKWARQYCPQAKFVMKIDDDTFVNVPMVFDYLLSKDVWERTIMGFINIDSIPFRLYTKWQVSWSEYPYMRYPIYTSGNIYVFLFRTSCLLLDVAEYIPYVSMEDVYITGILAEVIHAKHRLIPLKWYSPYKTASPCELATNKKMASQMITAKLHYLVWKAMQEKICD
ncbi:beta-1,3-galactosyltransferase 5 isoform X1 [Octopus bimaculoides]|uniref:Hexosyltransferase n=2 Tax=Octopus bimaculoides TaxID=37653 RepID=A0A0L8GRK4_OCTBM|nr:beta-1,3-galactosyltransferase 5 isoform X1 [Octopus bimaculoides]|eukprot:XP_014778606.1 PREDICTED: beta-1,3-galactosyltransferase 5-like isoform X1 [Octopus bimaculoides]